MSDATAGIIFDRLEHWATVKPDQAAMTFQGTEFTWLSGGTASCVSPPPSPNQASVPATLSRSSTRIICPVSKSPTPPHCSAPRMSFPTGDFRAKSWITFSRTVALAFCSSAANYSPPRSSRCETA